MTDKEKETPVPETNTPAAAPEPAPETTTKSPKKPSKEKGPTAPAVIPTPPFEVPIKDILLAEHWNREKLGNNAGLAQSIKDVGLTQPLAVRLHPSKPGKFILIDGRRRHAALLEIGISRVPVFIKEAADDTSAEFLATVANVNRENLTDFEMAMECKRFSDAGKKNKEIARALGKSEGFVSQHLGVFKLPDTYVEALKKSKITFAKARSLARLDNEKDAEYFEKIEGSALDSNVSSDDLNTMIDAYLEKQAKKEGKTRNTAGKTKAEKKRGPTVKLTDYADPEVKKQISPVTNKAKYVEYFEYYTSRIQKTSSATKRSYLEGVLEGLELGSGLKELS
jgi:ParB/RepB/Spo0J family partition protein